MTKAVTSMEPLPAEIHVKIGAGREPKLHVPILEIDGAVFNRLVLREELNPADGVHKVSLQPYNLVGASCDPCTPLQIHRFGPIVELEPLQVAGLIRTLPEVDEPCRFTLPRAEPFADEIEAVSHIGVEHERQGRQPRSQIDATVKLMTPSLLCPRAAR